jgi:hypothetical protein
LDKHHIAHYVVGASALALAAFPFALPAPTPKAPIVVAHANRVTPHLWLPLSDEEKADLTENVKRLPRPDKFSIFCNDANCQDFAEDLQDAFEAAAWTVAREVSMTPLQPGITISGHLDCLSTSAGQPGRSDCASNGIWMAIEPLVRFQPSTIKQVGDRRAYIAIGRK